MTNEGKGVYSPSHWENCPCCGMKKVALTFDEWWELPTNGWYLGRMATDDEKLYAKAAWDAATNAKVTKGCA